MAARRQAVACAQAGRRVGRRRRRDTRRSSARWSTSTTRPGFDDARAARTGSKRSPTRATEAYASLGRFLVEEYAPHADRARPGRPRALRAVRARLQRHRARPRRDVRVGLGGAAPHRGRDARRSRERILPGATVDDGHRAPRDRPAPRHRRRRRVPALEPGPHRPHDRRAQRHALRHPRAGAARARR